jgi:antitoxin component of MazEF toxin-antitoxin module
MTEHPDYVVTRKVHRMGGSLLVALPKIWTEANGIERGGTVEVAFDGILKIRPAKLKTEAGSE